MVTSYALYILVGLISFIFILYLSEISASLIVILILLASFSLNENKQYFGESSQSGALLSTLFKFTRISLNNSSKFTGKGGSRPLGIRKYSTSSSVVLPVIIYSNPDQEKKSIYADNK